MRAAALVASASLLAPAVGSADNLVGNPGFEEPLAGTQQGPAPEVNTSFGNWLGYTQDNNHAPPSIVTAPVHTGAGAGHVLSTAGTAGGNGQFFVQDFQGFAPNQGYALDIWVYPVAAQTQAVMLFGWDRNAGAVAGSGGVTINPGSVTYEAWGRSAVVPGISYNSWHELTVVARPDLTSAFYEDGVQVAGIGIPGQQLPFDTSSTLLLGDDCGSCTTGGNEAVFDDVVLRQLENVPPTVNLTAPADGSLIHNGVLVSADAQDNPGGSGVNRVVFEYRLHGSTDAWQTRSVNTTAPYGFLWTSQPPDGVYDLRATGYDNDGNAQSTNPITVTVDNTAPALTVQCKLANAPPGTYTDCATGWYTQPAEVPVALHATATDTHGPVTIAYSNDGGPVTPFTTDFALGPGDHVVQFTATDAAGNVTTVQQPIQIDLDPPFAPSFGFNLVTPDVYLTQSGTAATVWFNRNGDYVRQHGAGTIDVTATPNDPQSGEDHANGFPTAADLGGGWNDSALTPTTHEYTFVSDASVPTGSFPITETNKAGMTGPASTLAFASDTTPPATTLRCNGAPCKSTRYFGPVTITLAAADGQSGIFQTEYTTDGESIPSEAGANELFYKGPFQITQDTTFYWQSLDNVSNLEAPQGPITVLDSPAPALGTNGRIVYDGMEYGATDLFTANPDGTNIKRVTDDPARDEGAQFSPDGTKIVWGSDRSGQFQIYVMNADGTGVTRLTNDAFSDSSPAFSPDGTKIAFTRSDGSQSDIWVMDANGANPRDITNSPSTWEDQASWSPDGKTLAFDSAPFQGADNDVFVENVDGTGLTDLTPSEGDDHDPAWSRDGTQIAFVSNRSSIQPELWMMDADGANQRAIFTGFSSDPAWSPDGKQLVFSYSPIDGVGNYDFNGFDTWAINPDGSNAHPVVHNAVYDGFPNWGSAASIPVTQPTSWHLTQDFLAPPGEQNPNPDSGGEAGVWSFGEEPLSGNGDPATFTLYTRQFSGSGESCWGSANPGFDGLAPDACLVTGGAAPTTDFDPMSDRYTVIGWKSPITGTVDVSGTLTMLTTSCGDGVTYRLQRGTTLEASGTIPGGGSGNFGTGTGGVDVQAGDVIWLLIGPNGFASCDSTGVQMDVTTLSGGGGGGGGGDAPQSSPNFTVNTTADHDDGACTQLDCTLREAINAANADPGTDTISFALPQGSTTIMPFTPLPAVTDSAVIDGNTAAGRVTIDGSNVTVAGAAGLDVTAGNSTLRGLVVNGFGVAGQAGIRLEGAGGDTVEATEIGTDITGTVARANEIGIDVLSSGNTIGGPDPGHNLISGNVEGIVLAGDANTITNNFVGTIVTGTAPLANTEGIRISGSGNKVGIPGYATGNVISGNSGSGIQVASGTGNRIQNNSIGTTPNPGADVGNQGPGIKITTTETIVGGVGLSERNSIAFNGAGGVIVIASDSTAANRNTIRGNAIFENQGLGIDLIFDSGSGGTPGVTPNDPGDTDSGPNDFQNFPVLSAATIVGNATRIIGSLPSQPNTQYTIDFYASTACDPSQFGEGERWIGDSVVGTDASGTAQIDTGTGITAPVSAGDFITATATDPAGSTSEFSGCIVATAPDVQPGPVFTVTSAADPGDGTCTIVDCTLREAIDAANAHPNGEVPDSIFFAIGSGGPQTIALTSPLPAITDRLSIDATTQPGFVGPPLIQLDGSGAGPGADAFVVDAPSSSIHGFTIDGFDTAVVLNGDGDHVTGNYIGVDPTGTAARPNRIGVLVTSANNFVGGTFGSASNVISGNSEAGIDLSGPAALNNQVLGNFVGVNAAGTARPDFSPRATGLVEINDGASGNRIGGLEPGERNVLSGGVDGVLVQESGGNSILGNYIGTNAAGTAAVGNAGDGVFVFDSPSTAIESNVVSGNFIGVFLGGPLGSGGSVLAGNFIGTDPEGNPADEGNSQDGVYVDFKADNSTIGGSGESDGNRIADNGGNGVVVFAQHVTILRNSIEENGGLGIDLQGDGVTPNDSGDADTGPNGLQNFPVLTAVVATEGGPRISGTLDSAPSTAYRLDYYASASCDPSGYGEGARWLGYSVFGTDTSGQLAFTTGPGLSAPISAGEYVTATATDPAGDTSEFSACVQAAADAAQAGPVFTVTSAADPGEGTCTIADCTLHEAIDAANARPGADSIVFALPFGSTTITPSTPLPEISDPVTIDATTQPGFAGSPFVLLEGSEVGFGDGLKITASNTTVRGLQVDNFPGIGIHVLDAVGDVVAGNYLGGNGGDGVRIEGGDGNRVGGTAVGDRDVAGANGGHGIFLDGTTNGIVEGNFSGTNQFGSAALANGIDGIAVDGGSGNHIDGNVASGNSNQGISIFGVFFPSTSGNTVANNIVGLDATGTTPIGNGGDGIRVYNGHDNVILGNRVSGNGHAGIAVYNAVSTGNSIRGNSIDGNAGAGIHFTAGASGNTVQANTIGSSSMSGRLAYDCTCGSGHDIFLVALDGDGMITSEPPEQLTNDPAWDGDPAISADGTRILFDSTRDTGHSQVYVMHADGTNVTRLTSQATTDDSDAGWSRDGSGVVFASNRDHPGTGNFASEVYVMDADGSAQTRLTFVGGSSSAAGSPDFSPDGTTIVYSVGNSGLWLMNADGTNQRQLTTGTDQHPAWSPDGTSIAFDRFDPLTGHESLQLVNVATRAVTPLPTVVPNAAHPAWSPDGRQIAFDTGDPRFSGVFSTEIGVINADGTGEHAVVMGDTPSDPSWGPGAQGSGNGGDGILIDNGSTGNTIGGTDAAAGNIIVGNGDAGVRIDSGSNPVEGNSIADNSGLGIDLNGDGVTPNDQGDADTGPNALQNFPLLTSSVSTGSASGISGTLDSAPSTSYRLDYYASAACDPSGYGEGARWLGASVLGTDSSGRVNFTTSPGSIASISVGEYVTATATDPAGNTSEFSACIQAGDAAQTGPTFTVNTADDHDDGLCSLTDCTLREAINAANAHANLPDGPDAIDFAAGVGPITISLTTQLPQITDPVRIDGTTQPGWLGPPIVTLDGADTGTAAGLDVNAQNTTVRGLVIVGFPNRGLVFEHGADHASVTDNYIGVMADGRTPAPNFGGIELDSAFSVVGGTTATDRNVIASNGGGSELLLDSLSSHDNVIEGNYIGVGADGRAVGEGPTETPGVFIVDAGTGIQVLGNVISGSSAGVRINNSNGVVVDGGNDIGTDAAVQEAVPNSDAGVLIEFSRDTEIGNSSFSGGGNVISGNGGPGILIEGTGIEGPGAGGTLIQQNRIGTDALGNDDGLGNAGPGILIQSGDGNNKIGGTRPTDGNRIAYNDGPGVSVLASSGNAIEGNSITGNSGLGIDLGGDGVTQNDDANADADVGANGLQNYPDELSAILTVPQGDVTPSGHTVTITGKLFSAPATTYRIEVFDNAFCGSETPRQGDRFLGAFNVTTDRTGEAAVRGSVPLDDVLGETDGVTMTATDPAGNTSEFAACTALRAGGQTTGATVTLNTDVSATEAGAADVAVAGVPPGAFLPPAPPVGAPIDSTPIDSTPIDSTPIDSTPIDSTPIDSTPIDSTPIDSTGVSADNLQQNGLGGIPLSQLPLKLPKTWASVLQGTNLAGLPENSVSLAQVLAVNPHPGLTWGDFDLTQSPLGKLTIGDVVLGGLRLSQIPIPGTKSTLANWCDAIAATPGFKCSDPNTLTQRTVMDTALEGVPIDSTPIDSTPIDSTPIDSTPIDSTPIDSTPIDSTPLGLTPLSQVNMSVSVLGGIPLSAVLNPAKGSPIRDISLGALPTSIKSAVCSAACAGPLGVTFDADHAAVRSTAKLRDLGAALNAFTIQDIKSYPGVTAGNIGPGLPPSVTLRDLLILVLPVPTNWEHMALGGIQPFAASGGLVNYRATITLTGTGPGGSADVVAHLADGAVYKARSATLTRLSDSTQIPLDAPTIGNGTVTWHIPALDYGVPFRLAFAVFPSLTIGTDRATVSVAPLGIPAVDSTPADVQVGDTFEGNDTPAAAQSIQPDHLYLSYLTTGRDGDWYTLPTPAAGGVTTFTLSHLQHDADLVVYGPGAQPLRSSPIDSTPIDSTPIDSTPLGQSTQPLEPNALQDVPIDSTGVPGGSTVVGISDNRGTSDEQVDVTSIGAGGTYLVHVVSYDGLPDTKPYLLRATQKPPPALPACQARVPGSPDAFPHAGEGTAGTMPNFAGVSPDAKTVILTDEKRIGDTYGATAETQVVSALTTFARRPEINGVVIPVEADPGVAAAYAAWDQEPCSPAKANDVVRAIGKVLDSFRTGHSKVVWGVIAGGDDIVPSGRVLDASTQANERGYRSTLGMNTNNEYVGATANSYLLTDDVYGDNNPQPFLSGQLFVPDWAFGRLVESPADITGQLAYYSSKNGLFTPSRSLITGYDFIADSASATSKKLQALPTTADELITPQGAPAGTGWDKNTFLDHLLGRNGITAPDVASPNAHYDHHQLLPAAGAPLVQSTEIPANLLAKLVFTIGCHSGYTIADWLYAVNDPFARDWAETYAKDGTIAYVGQQGYGLGDTDLIAYSEQLEVLFASLLNQMSMGEALMYAKQQYFGSLAVVSAYDQKVMNEATFYGLPMWHIGNGTPPAPPLPASTSVDQATGLTSVAIDAENPDFTFVHTPGGDYYTTTAGGFTAENRRPVEPSTTFDVTEPNLTPHGFVWTNAASTDTPITALFSRVVDDSAALDPELSGQVSFPDKVQSLRTVTTPFGQRQQLVLVLGRFVSSGDPDEIRRGTQTLFNTVQGKVLYSTSTDFQPPQMANLRVTRVANDPSSPTSATIGFSLDATDLGSSVKEIVAVYRSGTTWRTAYLTQAAGTNHWTGGGPGSASDATVDYYVQAVDAAGNVGVTSHKASAAGVPLVGATQGSITIAFAGTQASSGWFVPPAGAPSASVQVTLSSSDDSTLRYSLDGRDFKAYSAAFAVTGTGLHTVDVEASDNATASRSFGIDDADPTATISTPANGAVFLAGDSVRADYSCADAGSGIAGNGCVGKVPPGRPFDTSLPSGQTGAGKTFTVTATDNVGRTGRAQSTYTVWQWSGFFSPVTNLPVINSVNAGQAIPVKFSLGGNRGLSIFAPGYPKSQQIPCDSSAVVDGIEQTVTSGGSSLSYAAGSNQYTYVWKTDKAWAGQCRQLVLKFPLGSFRRADFKFK